MRGILKSATLVVGLLLAAGAFIAYLALGNVLNPAPYQVVVALRDIPRYTTITREMLAVDAQHVHESIARGYVLREEVDTYLGAVTIEPIYAGEPLSKMRLVTGEGALARKRLSLALEDKDQVAMVIPVKKGQCPQAIYPGDYINIVFGVGNVPPTSGRAGVQEGAAGAVGLSPVSASALHPYLSTELGGAPTGASQRTLPSGTGPSGPAETAPSGATGAPSSPALPSSLTEAIPQEEAIALSQGIMLPLAKAVVRDVLVLDVRREMVINPEYAAGGGEITPYIQGSVEALDCLVPAETQEILAFAIENGSLHIILLPHVAHSEEGENSPTLGVTWQDMLDLFYQERLATIQERMAQAMQVSAWEAVTPTVEVSAEAPVSVTEPISPQEAYRAPEAPGPAPTALPVPVRPQPTPTPVSRPISVHPSVPTMGGSSLMCLTGGALLLVLVGGGFILIRRRKR